MAETLINPNTENQRCGNCKFNGSFPAPTNEALFQCRRMPPTVQVVPVGLEEGKAKFQNSTNHPVVRATDWCGEWKPKLSSNSLGT